jgi:hypothetical protein
VSAEPLPVAAVVVATRGGAALVPTLASVAWAAERIVVDPCGRLDGRDLPAGVRRHPGAEPVAAATAPWVLLLEEGEVVSAPLADAIARALRAPAADGWTIGLEVHAFGGAFRPWGARVRLARRAGARLALRRGLGVGLAIAGRRERLAEPLVVRRAERLADAVTELDAESTALAALLRAADARPRAARFVAGPLRAGASVLLARAVGSGGRRWARWFLGVFAAYRVLATQAKLWELRDTEAAAR